MSQATQEQVLAIPTAHFNETIGKSTNGLTTANPKAYIQRLFQQDKAIFLPRVEADQDENYKQIIPYTILTAIEPQSGFPVIFQYTRTKQSGEQRLQGLKSVGVGGHISNLDTLVFPTDNNLDDHEYPYLESMLRELGEEVSIGGDVEIKHHYPVGIIYDDSTPVGRVHVGIAHVVRLGKEYDKLQVLDEALSDPKWLTLQELMRVDTQGYENWSKIVIKFAISGKITL